MADFEGAATRVVQEVQGDDNIFAGRDAYVVRNEAVAPPDRPALRDLREKVRKFWVQGVFEKSLHGQAMLALRKETMPEAVDHPWERVLELPDGTRRSVDPKTSALRLYEDASRMLLVLGEPGSGKTTTILELARDLIAEAERDESRPVPVVLNLATWGQVERKMGVWIAGELSSKYGAPKKLAKEWLERGGLVLLLDGLDEVAEGKRVACVSAINDYMVKVGVPGMCLCSRLREYASLGTKVRLSGAVRLEALTDAQVVEYVEAEAEKLAGFGEALRTDEGLREVARSPLMLSVMSLAYEGVPVGEVATPGFTTAQAWRVRAFRAYVGKMFKRRGEGVSRYKVPETVRWLHLIARRMKERSQTVFLIEDLQPDWLSRPASRAIYALVSRIMSVLAIPILTVMVIPLGVMIAQLAGTRLHVQALRLRTAGAFVRNLLFLGVSNGLIDGFRFALLPAPSMKQMSVLSRMLWVSLYVLIGSEVTFTLHTLLTDGNGSKYGSISYCALFGIIYGGRIDPLAPMRDIYTTETLHWSWKAAKWGAGLGFFMGALLVFIFFQNSDDARKIPSGFLFLCGVSMMVSLPLAALGAAFGGFVKRAIDGKTRPNEGIVLTTQNTLFALVATGVMMVSFVAVITRITGFGATTGTYVSVSAIVAIPIALWKGGIDVIHHYILRLMLTVTRLLPLRLPRFLDHCTSLVFLQKVGGGYVFVHRLLLEHFAESPDDRGA